MNWCRTLWLVTVLHEHGKWWRSIGREGRRANLRVADLRGADLRGADLSYADLSGANLRVADLRGADLSYANLRDANLRDADLRGANLRGANLSYANLRDANLRDADLRGAERDKTIRPLLAHFGVPVVEQLHTKILAAVDTDRACFDMSAWHKGDDYSGAYGDACGTTHCRAGWTVHLAGEQGYALEKKVGPSLAGALISLASCPWMDRVPNFYGGNDEALADIRECAAREQKEQA